jgi:hypothetical protein
VPITLEAPPRMQCSVSHDPNCAPLPRLRSTTTLTNMWFSFSLPLHSFGGLPPRPPHSLRYSARARRRFRPRPRGHARGAGRNNNVYHTHTPNPPNPNPSHAAPRKAAYTMNALVSRTTRTACQGSTATLTYHVVLFFSRPAPLGSLLTSRSTRSAGCAPPPSPHLARSARSSGMNGVPLGPYWMASRGSREHWASSQ